MISVTRVHSTSSLTPLPSLRHGRTPATRKLNDHPLIQPHSYSYAYSPDDYQQSPGTILVATDPLLEFEFDPGDAIGGAGAYSDNDGASFTESTASTFTYPVDLPLFSYDGSNMTMMQPMLNGEIGSYQQDEDWDRLLLASVLDDGNSPSLTANYAASDPETGSLDNVTLDLDAVDSSGDWSSSFFLPSAQQQQQQQQQQQPLQHHHHHAHPHPHEHSKRRSSAPKLHKATQSCDLCIHRKRRCDGSPASSATGFRGCTYCASHGADCLFTREVKKRGPKTKREEVVVVEKTGKVGTMARGRAKSFSAVHEANKLSRQQQSDSLSPQQHAQSFTTTATTSQDTLSILSSNILTSTLFPPYSALPTHPYASYHPPPEPEPCKWDPETGFYDREDVEALKVAAGGNEGWEGEGEEGGEGKFGWLRVPWTF